MARFSRAAYPFESIPDGEQKHIDFLLANAEEALHKAAAKRLAKGLPAQRGAHAPPHGLVVGSLEVENDLPSDLKVGLFCRPGEILPVIIRYSKAFGAPDWAPNAHGCAIKILNVDGANCFDGAAVHDIVCNNDRVFPFKDLEQYAIGTRAGVPRFLFPSWNPLNWRYREMALTYSAVHRILSGVLQEQYWSQIPYAFGSDRAAKYSIRAIGPFPDETVPDPAAREPSGKLGWNNYLTARLEQQLSTGGFAVELMVQLQAPGDEIEDAQDKWTGEFRRVATIRVPKQPVDHPENWWLAERISLNPGRCLRDHQPVGGIGRVRPSLYELISELRSEYNGITLDADGLPHSGTDSWTVTCPTVFQRLLDELQFALRAQENRR